MSSQHHMVFLLRVRAARGKRHFPAQYDIVIGGRALCGQHPFPPVVYFRHLGEKAVSAHIHAVSLIVDGLGDAAHGVGFLQYDHLVFPALP